MEEELKDREKQLGEL